MLEGLLNESLDLSVCNIFKYINCKLGEESKDKLLLLIQENIDNGRF